MEQTPVDLPRCEASRYMVKTIAVNLKLWLCFQTAMRSRKSQKVKVTFFFFPDYYNCRIGKVVRM